MLSTKLWDEDRTKFTETDGGEEEGITLAVEAQTERSGRKGDDRVIRQMEGVNTERGVGRRRRERSATVVKDEPGSRVCVRESRSRD